MHCHGILSCPQTKETYTGDWYRGRWHGWGAWRQSDGSVFTGQFYMNKPHGVGVVRMPNGSKQEGLWEHGRTVGHGVFRLQYALGKRKVGLKVFGY